MSSEPTQALVSLGFSAIEAEAYTTLLGESPATGYRVAQSLGRQVANVYKALESLERKGAVIAEKGAHNRFRAVPPAELLQRLQRDFLERRAVAEQALANLPISSDDDRVYSLSSREQVFERARAMIGRTTRVLLLDTVSRPLEELRPEIEAAAARGVEVAVRTDEPTALAGVELLCRRRPDVELEDWPGDWLCVFADGGEQLLAFMADTGEVQQAVWSGSAYLSWIGFCGAWAEIVLEAVMQRIDDSATTKDLAALVKERATRFLAAAPGRERILHRFATSGTDGGSASPTAGGSRRDG